MNKTLTVALAKGRILKEALPLLEAAGIRPLEDVATTRKLILDTTRDEVKLVVIRSADVPTYVQFGAADIGVVGKDVIMEFDGNGYYEMLDLGIARCRMAVAAPADKAGEKSKRLRIATKYVKIAREFYASRGIQTEMIKLYGSMELAPIAGLADRIVDLVDTGNTLKANGLVEVEKIAEISSRLIVNKAATRMKHDLIMPLVEIIKSQVQ